MTIEGRFDAPDGLNGYAADYRGHPVAIYLTPNGRYAVIGTLVDAQGNNLSAAPLKRLVTGPKYKGAWGKLEGSTWVADGSDKADRVIYMFFDANCPYCHKFWEMARPWVEAGRVQIRHIPVGLLKPSSLPKAASILAATDPSAALTLNERKYGSGAIGAMKNVPPEIAAKIESNTSLMKSLDLFATPTIFWHDAGDKVQVTQGVPGPQGLEAIMGSPEP